MVLLSVIILLFWISILVRTMVNLAVVPRLRARQPVVAPLVSVIVPARDEERRIEHTVRAFLAQDYPNLEIVVVEDRSTDATPAILASFDDPRLVVVHNADDPPQGWLGKPWALHQGSLRAKGELLLFVDADVTYAPGAVSAAVAHMEERDVPMLALFPNFEMHGFWEHVAMPDLTVFGFTFIPLWLSNRTKLPFLGVGGGSGNLVRRDAYDAAGGHEALKAAVVDDVGLARLFRRRGFRTELARAERWVSVRMYHGLAEIVRGFTKNAFSVFNRNYVSAIFYASAAVVFHLLPFALALTGNVYAIATIALIVITRVVLYRSFGYRLDNAIFAHPLMIAVWLWILVRSVWMTGIRRQLHWRGRSYDPRHTRFGAD